MRVEAAGVRHHVRRHAAERLGLHAGAALAVDGGAVAAEPDEADRARLEPPHQPLDARGAGAVLVDGELLRLRPSRASRGRSSRSPCVEDACARVAVDGDEPGCERRGPEAVARAREADAGVGGVQARVQPAEQQPHPGPTTSGSVRARRTERVEPVVLRRVDDAPRARRTRRPRAGRSAAPAATGRRSGPGCSSSANGPSPSPRSIVR